MKHSIEVRPHSIKAFTFVLQAHKEVFKTASKKLKTFPKLRKATPWIPVEENILKKKNYDTMTVNVGGDIDSNQLEETQNSTTSARIVFDFGRSR